MTQKQNIKIIIYVVLLITAVSLLVWWFIYNSIRIKDYQRLGDMRILESEMNIYFLKFNTYKIPECSEGMLINFCTGRSGQSPNVSTLIDPVNTDSLRYVLTEMTDDNFRVEFYLESGLLGLTSGKYALTNEGLDR